MFQRLFGTGNTQGEMPPDVDVLKVQQLQQEGVQLIDVREPGEFASGHAKGAHNIPLGQLAQRQEEVQRNGTVLVICQSGNRSEAAQGLLKRLSVADVRNVRGGTSAWRAAGLPIE